MTNQRDPRPVLREEHAPYRVRPAAPVERARVAPPDTAELRRLVRRRAAALIELEKN